MNVKSDETQNEEAFGIEYREIKTPLIVKISGVVTTAVAVATPVIAIANLVIGIQNNKNLKKIAANIASLKTTTK